MSLTIRRSRPRRCISTRIFRSRSSYSFRAKGNSIIALYFLLWIGLEPGERFRRVEIRQHRIGAHGDLGDMVLMLLHEALGAAIAVEAQHLLEMLTPPQHRITALAGMDR